MIYAACRPRCVKLLWYQIPADPVWCLGKLPPVAMHKFITTQFGGIVNGIRQMCKPVIAAVNGFAMGVAMFTVLRCLPLTLVRA